ncbi:MAG TPA: sulfotransferase domain-containing protein [Acidimicrobiia bacterium]|nr:sulfotransferase domain-containing protein [Acidimicrobiia bacterium]
MSVTTAPSSPLQDTSWKARTKSVARSWTLATSRVRPLPEVLIIGAQRCGTTSLYRYLSEHPQFAPATLGTKGVHFFDNRYDRGLGWYRAHFPTTITRRRFRAVHGADMITGEGSPYYLFHPHVPYRIAEDLPEAKLIVMLRDPVERAYSQWQHELSRGFEHLDRFEDAVDAEAGRLAGEVPRMNADPGYRSSAHQHWSYLARGRYADQLEVYRELFPPAQLLVIKAEDFFSDPESEYLRVERFLGLAEHHLAAYEKHNGHKRAPMDPATRARLVEHFADSNRRLVEMLGPGFTWEP